MGRGAGFLFGLQLAARDPAPGREPLCRIAALSVSSKRLPGTAPELPRFLAFVFWAGRKRFAVALG